MDFGENSPLIYLAIYKGVEKEWHFESLVEMMKWLYGVTKEENCYDAIQVAYMFDLTEEEQLRLSLLKDFYLAQFDGKLKPKIDLDSLYDDVVFGRVKDFRYYLKLRK